MKIRGDYMKKAKELLGARIKELRKARGFTQEQFAEMIGVEPRHVSRMEGGYTAPSINRLEKIAEALNIPLKDFFDFMHLDSPDTRTKNMEELVKGMNEDYQRIIYKIVKAFGG
jgi:transcriptional regulator with XRE-family HTH domain